MDGAAYYELWRVEVDGEDPNIIHRWSIDGPDAAVFTLTDTTCRRSAAG